MPRRKRAAGRASPSAPSPPRARRKAAAGKRKFVVDDGDDDDDDDDGDDADDDDDDARVTSRATATGRGRVTSSARALAAQRRRATRRTWRPSRRCIASRGSASARRGARDQGPPLVDGAGPRPLGAVPVVPRDAAAEPRRRARRSSPSCGSTGTATTGNAAGCECKCREYPLRRRVPRVRVLRPLPLQHYSALQPRHRQSHPQVRLRRRGAQGLRRAQARRPDRPPAAHQGGRADEAILRPRRTIEANFLARASPTSTRPSTRRASRSSARTSTRGSSTTTRTSSTCSRDGLRQAINHRTSSSTPSAPRRRASRAGAAARAVDGGICGICFEDADDVVVTSCNHSSAASACEDYIESLDPNASSQCPTRHAPLSVDLNAAAVVPGGGTGHAERDPPPRAATTTRPPPRRVAPRSASARGADAARHPLAPRPAPLPVVDQDGGPRGGAPPDEGVRPVGEGDRLLAVRRLPQTSSSIASWRRASASSSSTAA